MLKSGEIIFNKKEKKESKKIINDEKKLGGLIKTTQEVLFEASSVFPFDLFPDEIAIQRNKIDIINREFFASEELHTVLIENIVFVEADVTMILASVKLMEKQNTQNVMSVKYLSKKNAIKARNIIQGLILALEDGLDISDIPKEKLVLELERLGNTRESRLSNPK